MNEHGVTRLPVSLSPPLFVSALSVCQSDNKCDEVNNTKCWFQIVAHRKAKCWNWNNCSLRRVLLSCYNWCHGQ